MSSVSSHTGPKGNIVFLNGTSSAGKTTLAHALQSVMQAPYLHIALDQFRDGLPDKFRGLNSPEGTDGNAGLNVVPVTDVPKPYTEIRFGDEGKKMLCGMRRAMAVMAQTGNNIIIDDIILRPEFLDDYLNVFEPYNVIFVAVRCPQTVINMREEGRPGRFPGTAAGHFEICHAHGHYDVEVDTSSMTPQACAERIAEFVNTKQGKAFAKLRSCNTGSKISQATAKR